MRSLVAHTKPIMIDQRKQKRFLMPGMHQTRFCYDLIKSIINYGLFHSLYYIMWVSFETQTIFFCSLLFEKRIKMKKITILICCLIIMPENMKGINESILGKKRIFVKVSFFLHISIDFSYVYSHCQYLSCYAESFENQ